MCGNNFCGNNIWWIIILLLLFCNCGNTCGNACETNTCGGCGGCGCN